MSPSERICLFLADILLGFSWSSLKYPLLPVAQQSPPDGILRVGWRDLPGHVSVAVPQEAEDSHGDVYQAPPPCSGHQRSWCAGQTYLRQALQLDCGAHQQSSNHQCQTALLHRGPRHLRVRMCIHQSELWIIVHLSSVVNRHYSVKHE